MINREKKGFLCMFKKIIYVFVSALVILFIMLSSSARFIVNEGQRQIKAALKDGRYEEAVGFYMPSWYDKTPLFVSEAENNPNTLVHIYASGEVYTKKEERDSKEISYQQRDHTYEIIVFQHPETFAMSKASVEAKGTLKVKFADGNVYTKELFQLDEKKERVVSSVFDSYPFYSFLSIRLSARELESNANQSITELVIHDYNNENPITLNIPEGKVNFDQPYYQDFGVIVNEFNQLNIDAGGEKSKIDSAKMQALEEKLTKLLDDHKDQYYGQTPLGKITNTSSFKGKMVMTFIISLLVCLGLGFLLFFRKKPSYIPKKAEPQVATQNANVNMSSIREAEDVLVVPSEEVETKETE